MAPSVATTTRPDRDTLLAFLRERSKAVLMTTRSDGRPQSSPVSCGVDAEGRLVISTYPERVKARNVRRDARVSVCMLSFSVSVSCEKKFAGSSGDPTFDEVMGVHPLAVAGAPRPWDEYCDAFAD